MASQEEIDCWWAELGEIEAAVAKFSTAFASEIRNKTGATGPLFFDPYKSQLRPQMQGGQIQAPRSLSLEEWTARGNENKFDDLQLYDKNFIGYTGLGVYDYNKFGRLEWTQPAGCGDSAKQNMTVAETTKYAKDLYHKWYNARLDEIEAIDDDPDLDNSTKALLRDQQEDLIASLNAQRIGVTEGRVEIPSITDDFKKRPRFVEQVWLLSRIKEISNERAFKEYYDYTETGKGNSTNSPGNIEPNKAGHPKRETGWMYPIEGPGLDLMNIFTADEDLKALNTIPQPAGWNMHSPVFDFYLLKKNAAGDTVEVPIVFDQNAEAIIESIINQDIEEIEESEACGKKNFTWSYKGQNIYTSNKDIEATLELVSLKGLSPFFKERESPVLDGTTETYQYIDLAIRHRDFEASDRHQDPTFSKIKVKVGWAVGYGASSPGGANNVNNDNGAINDMMELAQGGSMKVKSADDPPITEIMEAQKKALEKCFMTLYLYPTNHTFNINENGSVSLSIQYRALLAEMLDDFRANVLSSPKLAEQRKQRFDLEEGSELLKSQGICTKEFDAKLKKAFIEGIGAEKSAAYESLLDGLAVSGRIYHLQLPAEELLNFSNDPFKTTQSFSQLSLATDEMLVNFIEAKNTASKALNNADPEAAEEAQAAVLKTLAGRLDLVKNPSSLYGNAQIEGSFSLQYFFLGDLIDQALENMFLYGDEEFKKDLKNFRVVLGDFDITDPKTGEIFQVNMADIPISVSYFVEWFMDRILKLTETYYSFMDFVKDVTKHMVVKVLQSKDYFQSDDFSQKADFQHTFLFGRGVAGKDPLAEILRQQKDIYTELYDPSVTAKSAPLNNRINMNVIEEGQKPILGFSEGISETSPDEMYQFLLIFGRSRINRKYENDPDKDAKNGVLWFNAKSTTGLLKKLNFTKVDGKGVKEARTFGKNRSFDNANQLFEPYKVDMTMYGFPKILPGQMVYINPTALSQKLGATYNKKSLSYALGIGGYHVVNRVTHTIDVTNKFETVATANWESSGAEANKRNAQGQIVCGDLEELSADQKLVLAAYELELINYVANRTADNRTLEQELQQQLERVKAAQGGP